MASPDPKKGPDGAPHHHILPDALNPAHQLRVMGRFVRRQSKKPGAPPGTLVHTGQRRIEQPLIRWFEYGVDRLDEGTTEDITELWRLRDSPETTWINVDGLHDVELVEAIGEHFGLHPLVREDIVSVGQRPKLEEHDGYLFLVLPMLTWAAEHALAAEEQLSLILGPGWVLTFQERRGDVFEPVRERIRASNRRIRARGNDYLAYALVDTVVDRYFGILEGVGEVTEELELEVLEDPSPATMHRLHRLKREMLVVRKAVWPLREMMSELTRSETPLVDDETRVYLRDVYDHAVRVIDTVESLRDVVSGTIDLYLSHVSHKQNEIMKVLTIMASIFIPLTFFAGVYGMNFEYMPELGVRWAYPALLGLMAVVGSGMVVYFYRKGWL